MIKVNGHKPRKRRAYSDEDKAAALAVVDAQGSVNGAAKVAGVPSTTLQDWASGRNISNYVREIREQKKQELSAIFEHVARVYLDRALDDNAIIATTGKDAIMSAAIATDKNQLLSGKPTQINEARSDMQQRERVISEASKLAEKHGVTPDEAMAALLKANPELEKWVQ